MEGTWYKLKAGTWAVKVRHDAQPGDEVSVTNKKGETKTVWLVTCEVKFDDAQLWSITEEAPQKPVEDPF